MSDDLTFADVMAANTAHDIDSTAKAIAGAIGLSGLQYRVLLPLIRDEVRRLWRSTARDVEPSFSASEAVDPAADRRSYLEARFKGVSGYVTWGEATVEDHRAYVDMLQKLRGGIERTIAAHEQAIEQIVAAGVTCLNDIVGAAAGAAA